MCNWQAKTHGLAAGAVPVDAIRLKRATNWLPIANPVGVMVATIFLFLIYYKTDIVKSQ